MQMFRGLCADSSRRVLADRREEIRTVFRKEGRGYNRMVAIQEWSPQKPGTDELGDIVFLAVESHQANDRDK